jgi:hypothetical protein
MHPKRRTPATLPTKHARISVVRDTELDQALERVERLLGPGKPATRVRELAIRGAQALEEDEARRQELRERLIKRTDTPGWMGGMTAEEVDRGAWGFERD